MYTVPANLPGSDKVASEFVKASKPKSLWAIYGSPPLPRAYLGLCQARSWFLINDLSSLARCTMCTGEFVRRFACKPIKDATRLKVIISLYRPTLRPNGARHLDVQGYLRCDGTIRVHGRRYSGSTGSVLNG